MILSKDFFFQNIKKSDSSSQINKFKNKDDSEVFSSDFQALETSPASLTSVAYASSLASTASKVEFPQEIS